MTFGPPSWGFPVRTATPVTQDSTTLAFSPGALYGAWKAEGTDDVSYSTNNGSAWSTPVPVSGTWGTAVTVHTPALVSYSGDLYTFWTTKAEYGVVLGLRRQCLVGAGRGARRPDRPRAGGHHPGSQDHRVAPLTLGDMVRQGHR